MHLPRREYHQAGLLVFESKLETLTPICQALPATCVVLLVYTGALFHAKVTAPMHSFTAQSTQWLVMEVGHHDYEFGSCVPTPGYC